jgi:AcrR family transcriptional regulator
VPAANEDPRWTRSRAALIEAVTTLVDSGHALTITDVVHRAGVSRPTFYQHFGDLSTALSSAALERVEAQFAVLPSSLHRVDIEFTRHTIRALLSHLQEHSVFYRAVLSDSSARRFTASVVEFVANRILTVSPLRVEPLETASLLTADRIAVLAAGFVWLITQWVKRTDDDAEPITDMANRLIAVMESFDNTASTPSHGDPTPSDPVAPRDAPQKA